MKKSIINVVLKTARDKLDNHPQTGHWMHYSFIIQYNKLIEWATNLNYDPPLHYGYRTRINDINYKPKIHSEIASYKKAKGILKKDYFEIINIRLNKMGELRLSKPCVCCYEILKALGCRSFYYSCDIGFLKV